MKHQLTYSALYTVFFILILFSNTPNAFANKVTLQLSDGNLLIEGDLVSFDGKKYTIQSPELGKATFEASRFICIDGECPQKNSNPFAFHDSTTDFSIYGSNSIGVRLMPWIIRGYIRDKGFYGRETVSNNGKEVRFSLTNEYNETITNITLHRYGSNTAFPALIKRQAIIGMSSRAIKNAEISRLKDKQYQNFRNKHEHAIGVDGLVFIVSRQNPIENLSLKQLAAIFSGKITDWSEVGGNPGKINIYTPNEESGILNSFKSKVMQPRTLKVSNKSSTIDSSLKLSQAVAKDPEGIGVTSYAYIDKAKPVSLRSRCGLNYKPTAFNIRTGAYPLTRKLYLYTASIIENRHAVGLLNFAKNSKDMNSILNIGGFVNQRISEISFNEQRERVFSSMAGAQENFNTNLMRRLLNEIGEGKRLSYTARFQPNTMKLTEYSREEFPRLIAYIRKEVNPDNYIIIAGFSDTEGKFSSNTALSLQRAKKVQTLLKKSLNGKMRADHILARGYSELLPTACNTSEVGRKKNRRVEIWVVDGNIGKKLEKEQIIIPPLTEQAHHFSHLLTKGQ